MPTTSLPYNLSSDPQGNDTLTVWFDFASHVVARGEEAFDLVLDVLRDESMTDDQRKERIVAIMAPASTLVDAVDGSRVTVENNRVLFDGEVVPSGLTRKLLSIVRAGLSIDPWKRFTVRLFANPSRGAQAELNEFLEAGHLPITEDGCIVAYKRVRDNFTDVHTGTFDNSPGQIVSMPREDVDADRSRTCSSGLHVCSQEYLKHFTPGRGKIVAVKVDPADVVSIPVDYNFTKARVARYEVLEELPLDTEEKRAEWGVYAPASLNGTTGWVTPVDTEEDEEWYTLVDSDGDTYDEASDLDALTDVAVNATESYMESWEIRDNDWELVRSSADYEPPTEDGVVEEPLFPDFTVAVTPVVGEAQSLDSMEEVVADADANRRPGESRMEYLKRKWRNRNA